MTSRSSTLLLVLACAVSLTACEKSTKDAQADAIRDTSKAAGADIDQQAEGIEDEGKAAGDAATAQAESTAEALRDKADAVRARGERQADAVDAGTTGATTKTDKLTTTTKPDPK